MSVHIVADSTCDLSKELVDRYQITVLPLYVRLAGADHRDGVDITAADIFRHVDGGGELPQTAAVTVADFQRCIRDLRAQDPDGQIILITISAKLSSCYQNAVIASQEVSEVYPIDSRNLSTGFGHVVLTACELAEQGMDASDICEQLHDVIPRVDASFIVDRLDYLRKGGRCSAVAALGANLLQLKPCIAVTDGEMRVVKKYRGSFVHVIDEYVRERLADMDGIVPRRIFITHPAAPREAVEAARAAIAACGKFESVTETNAGCTVSSHCGPHTLGVLFIRK